MIISDRSYPHPVLAPFTDDVSPNRFELSLTTTFDADYYYLDVGFEYENATLADLAVRGLAAHAVHLECKRNYYREVFAFAGREKRITVKASELVGRVEVSGFVKATAPIGAYEIAGAHSDYDGVAFELRTGDVLAVAESQVFDAYTDYDPLRRISSILTIQRSEDADEGPMILDTSGHQIVATLSQNDYERYTDLKGDPNLGPLLANQVVVPAVLQAVFEIVETDEAELEFEMTRRWFRSVYKRLEELGIDVRSRKREPIEAVQELLRLPLRRSLEGLLQMNPTDD